jgi:hypothetical protein
VVAKALVGWTGQGGVLKTGLQVRSEEERQLARNSRDSWRMHVTFLLRVTGEEAAKERLETMYCIVYTDEATSTALQRLLELWRQ